MLNNFNICYNALKNIKITKYNEITLNIRLVDKK